MKLKLRDAIGNMDYDDLVELNRDLVAGAVNIQQLVSDHISKKEFEMGKHCVVCQSDINPEKTQNYTLLFGPEGLRRKATFCAVDCLKYFITDLERRRAQYKKVESKIDFKQEKFEASFKQEKSKADFKQAESKIDFKNNISDHKENISTYEKNTSKNIFNRRENASDYNNDVLNNEKNTSDYNNDVLSNEKNTSENMFGCKNNIDSYKEDIANNKEKISDYKNEEDL